jgi:hypothetical protein
VLRPSLVDGELVGMAGSPVVDEPGQTAEDGPVVTAAP